MTKSGTSVLESWTLKGGCLKLFLGLRLLWYRRNSVSACGVRLQPPSWPASSPLGPGSQEGWLQIGPYFLKEQTGPKEALLSGLS